MYATAAPSAEPGPALAGTVQLSVTVALGATASYAVPLSGTRPAPSCRFTSNGSLFCAPIADVSGLQATGKDGIHTNQPQRLSRKLLRPF